MQTLTPAPSIEPSIDGAFDWTIELADEGRR
jgi:hypothetical protein